MAKRRFVNVYQLLGGGGPDVWDYEEHYPLDSVRVRGGREATRKAAAEREKYQRYPGDFFVAVQSEPAKHWSIFQHWR